MSESVELLPCPFCGKVPRFVNNNINEWLDLKESWDVEFEENE